MAQYSKKILSGTTNGKPLSIQGATTSGGTLVHTAVTATGANQADEIWLWAFNTASNSDKLTMSFGGVTGSDRLEYIVPGQDGLFMLSPGLVLNGGLELRCHASTSNVLSVVGYVNSVVT